MVERIHAVRAKRHRELSSDIARYFATVQIPLLEGRDFATSGRAEKANR